MSELLWSDPFEQLSGGEDMTEGNEIKGDSSSTLLKEDISAGDKGDNDDGASSAVVALNDEGWAPSSRGAGLLWGKVKIFGHS